MPWAPVAACSTPGCPNKGPGKCTTCRRKSERRRGSAASRGYGAHWRKIRAAKLERDPFCDECGESATDVDHEPTRKELVDRGVPDPDADQYLHSKCHRHHSRKTAVQNRLGRRE